MNFAFQTQPAPILSHPQGRGLVISSPDFENQQGHIDPNRNKPCYALAELLRPGLHQLILRLLHDATENSVTEINEKAFLLTINTIFTNCDWLTRNGYQALLYLLEWMPVFLTGVFSLGRLSRLSNTKRHAQLEAMRTSRFYFRRALFKALLAPIWISHYSLGANQLKLGFDSGSLSTFYQRVDQDD
jgi:hypothetical protein